MKKTLIVCIVTALASGCIFSGTSTPVPSNNDTDGDAGITDMTVPANCGDGLLQPEERCDPSLPVDSIGACPASCDDGIACTLDTLTGSAETCSAECTNTVIDTCANNDGCCPANCSPDDDTDCDPSVVCGDGSVDGAELCDPGLAAGTEGACPASPDDCPTQMCQTAVVAGAAQNCDAACAYIAITTCKDGDDCCAPGCSPANDDDCAAVCGNDVTELGEVCDGNCPSSCDDGDACTNDTLEGSADDCDARCLFDAITACEDDDGCCPSSCDSTTDNDCSASCGNGTVEGTETCDPVDTCPVSCNDNDPSTSDMLIGSAANCNAECVFNAITTCDDTTSDGYCPDTCDANNDVDCDAVCGNGTIEPGETCEASCPSSCDDNNACTTDTLSGDPDNCTSACTYSTIDTCSQTSDGCCPASCNANTDADCGPVCGNDIVEGNETCDGDCPTSCNDSNACTTDIATGSAATCSFDCSHSPITACDSNDGCCPDSCNANNDSDCDSQCGNGAVEGAELCDGDCPTASECAVCETYIGDPPTCDAQCAPIANCVECDPSGTCTCSNGQLCQGGKCVPGDGTTCSEACNPDGYCEAYNLAGWTCSSGTCIECTEDSQCGAIEACVNNFCVTAPSCGAAKNPADWCAQRENLDTCYNNECYVRCTTNSTCQAEETCDKLNAICVVPGSCSQANQPRTYCQVLNGTAYDTCYQGDCYASCPDPGANGACSCPDPGNEGCFSKSSTLNLCEPAFICTQVCDSNDAFGDDWCDAQGEGAFCNTSTQTCE